MRKDLRELTGTLKDYQELEFKQKQLDRHRQDQVLEKNEEVERRLQECEVEKAKTQEERNKTESLRAAFNADKAALSAKVSDLESLLKQKDVQFTELLKRLDQADMNDSHARNELNFWNGKVSTMRRDMDYMSQFNGQLAEENKSLKSDIEALRAHLIMKDKDQNLLQR